MQTDIVYDAAGNKVGVIVLDGMWTAYNLSDIEVYRGTSYLLACWTLQGRA